MAQITLKNAAGKDAGTVDLDDAIVRHPAERAGDAPGRHRPARRPPGRHAEHQDPRRGARRRRQAVRQKGTGNARQGSTRAPHYSGGGVALGPKPRKYDQKTPKKMITLALRSALSDRASEGKVLVVDSWGFDAPEDQGRRRRARARSASTAGCSWSSVATTPPRSLSFRNLPEVQLIAPGELNAYDVLCNDWIVFTEDTLPTLEASRTPPRSSTRCATSADADEARPTRQ